MAKPVRAARSHYFLAGLEIGRPDAPHLQSEETWYVLPSARWQSGKTSCSSRHTSYCSKQLNTVADNYVDRPLKSKCCPTVVVVQKRVRSCLALACRSLRENYRLAALALGFQYLGNAANLRRPWRSRGTILADLHSPTKAQLKAQRQLKRGLPRKKPSKSALEACTL
jgi:hypothetical protein